MRILVLLACIFAAFGTFAHDKGLDAAITSLREGAEASQSDSVLVLQGEQVLLEQYRRSDARVFELMSVTKSVVALAIGALQTDGLLRSLDVPLSDFYPEWKQGRKAQITVRMLMNHTSGLQNDPNASAEIYPAPDFVKLALAAELSDDPGTTFSYNNKAMNLLAGVVQKVSGQAMDVYLQDRLFKPMGIQPGPWMKDKAGNPHSMAGLPLSARDLAKIGRLVLDRGRYEGRTLIAEAFITDMLQASPHYELYGLLWWRLPDWRKYQINAASFEMLANAGVDAEVISSLRTLDGQSFASAEAVYQSVVGALGERGAEIWQEQVAAKGVRMSEAFHLRYGPIVAYEGNGYLGQYLVIVPDADLIAVRQIAPRDDYQPSMGYQDFSDRVLRLAKAWLAEHPKTDGDAEKPSP